MFFVFVFDFVLGDETVRFMILFIVQFPKDEIWFIDFFLQKFLHLPHSLV